MTELAFQTVADRGHVPWLAKGCDLARRPLEDTSLGGRWGSVNR